MQQNIGKPEMERFTEEVKTTKLTEAEASVAAQPTNSPKKVRSRVKIDVKNQNSVILGSTVEKQTGKSPMCKY